MVYQCELKPHLAIVIAITISPTVNHIPFLICAELFDVEFDKYSSNTNEKL
jgi:hypothetical protein